MLVCACYNINFTLSSLIKLIKLIPLFIFRTLATRIKSLRKLNYYSLTSADANSLPYLCFAKKLNMNVVWLSGKVQYAL